jgi:hypothetical protein
MRTTGLLPGTCCTPVSAGGFDHHRHAAVAQRESTRLSIGGPRVRVSSVAQQHLGSVAESGLWRRPAKADRATDGGSNPLASAHGRAARDSNRGRLQRQQSGPSGEVGNRAGPHGRPEGASVNALGLVSPGNSLPCRRSSAGQSADLISRRPVVRPHPATREKDGQATASPARWRLGTPHPEQVHTPRGRPDPWARVGRWIRPATAGRGGWSPPRPRAWDRTRRTDRPRSHMPP